MSLHEDDEYHLPLVDQRVFGAGLKRKRIAFVPASAEPSIPEAQTTKQNAGDRYLSIVLKDSPSTPSTDADNPAIPTPQDPSSSLPICTICGQSAGGTDEAKTLHESSITHQIALEHSHQPSHLDRTHVGLRYLQDYGWDPDARKGLGAHSKGIRIPIKPKEKRDSAGLGMRYEEEGFDGNTSARKRPKGEEKAERLNAKDVRRREREKSKRSEKLRKEVYGPDLSFYLGANG